MPATQEQLEFRKRWAAALRSGEYMQTRGCLHDERGYCCIGVAAKVVNPSYEVPKLFSLGQGIQWKIVRLIGDVKAVNRFASLNDDDRLTFPQIADRIENDPTLFGDEVK